MIYFSFLDIKCNTFEESFSKICEIISEEYARHSYILDSGILKEHQRNRFEQILNLKATRTLYETSLKKLVEYLKRYHKEKSLKRD